MTRGRPRFGGTTGIGRGQEVREVRNKDDTVAVRVDDVVVGVVAVNTTASTPAHAWGRAAGTPRGRQRLGGTLCGRQRSGGTPCGRKRSGGKGGTPWP